MFILSKFSDVVKLAPDTFSIPTETALTSAINAKFSNKVVQDLGLCICLYDIISNSDGIVKAGDGCAYVTVEFRLVVFRPFIGEVLTGKIASCSEAGIKVTLTFFDDIFIPSHLLLPETVYNKDEQVWVWNTEDAELYFDENDVIRFRIEEELFVDCTPEKPGEVVTNSSPYTLTASAQISGLGCVSWWAD